MAQVRWTPQAADILQAVDQLADFPESGRVVPEISNRGIREILFGSYRIIYRLRRDAIEVLTVHHGARLLDPRRLRR